MDNCTVYLQKLDLELVLGIIRDACSHGQGIAVAGDEQSWQYVTIDGMHAMKLTPLKKVARGDKFSQLQLSTDNYFSNIKGARESLLKEVQDAIWDTKLMLGVSATPEFSEDEDHYEIIFRLCQELGGVVFTGTAMLDDRGILILDQDGQTERS